MAKNPGRGNKIFRRNTIPNLVGQLTTTAQSTLTTLGFNSTVTNESTGDSNLNNKVKSQSLTGDAALGTNVNLVNYTFSFSPFGAFGFTPFGFTPFGFTPFGFTPWSMVGCIEADTLIETASGATPVKDIKAGDLILTINIPEIPLEDVSSSDYEWRTIALENLTSLGMTETQVTHITPIEVQEVLWFNGDDTKKYSLTQPFFVKDFSYYMIKEAGSLAVGETLLHIKPDGSILETEIKSIDTDDSLHTVYQLSCEPEDWFIAGNYLVHNK